VQHPALRGDVVHELAKELAVGIERIYDTPTPEHLHDLRTAIARFQAISHAVDDGATRRQLRHLGKDLRWLRHRTAAARDWDVFVADQNLRQHLDRHHVRFAIPTRELAARRRNALDDLARALREQRCFELEARLRAITGKPDAKAGVEEARRALARRRRKVRRLGRHFRKRDYDELHALRRALKQLRYTCELLRPDGDLRMERYLDSLKRLLHRLGRLQDAVSGAVLAQTLSSELRKPVRRYYNRRARRLRRRAFGAWKDFLHCKEPW